MRGITISLCPLSLPKQVSDLSNEPLMRLLGGDQVSSFYLFAMILTQFIFVNAWRRELRPQSAA